MAKTDTKVTADQKKILKALSKIGEPTTNKAVAEETKLDPKVVGNQVKKLKTAGFVDSPARCRIGVTPAGKKATG